MKNPDENSTPRIYVASLADYNAGNLHGCWIDADQPADAIREQIDQMLAVSSEPIAEEWAIHDYDNFGGLRLSEFEEVENVVEIARLLAEYGPVFAELVNYFGGTSNLEEASRYMEEGYRGEYSSLADYAQEFVEDCYSEALRALPDFIRYRIDFDGIGTDMEYGGDIFTVSCGWTLHVFEANI